MAREGLRDIGLGAGLIVVGVTIASTFWGAFWTSTYSRLRDDLNRTQAQLLNVQSEYAAYRGRNPESRTQSAAPVPPPSQTQALTGGTPAAGSSQTGSEDKRIEAGSTQTFFGEDLSISVVGMSFEGNPLRDKVTAILGSPGLPNQNLDRQDVGYVVRYKGRGTFEIRIVAADTFGAEFRVTRIQP